MNSLLNMYLSVRSCAVHNGGNGPTFAVRPAAACVVRAEDMETFGRIVGTYIYYCFKKKIGICKYYISSFFAIKIYHFTVYKILFCFKIQYS